MEICSYAPKHKSVKTTQDPNDIGRVFVQGCLHGVPPWMKLLLSMNSRPRKEGHNPFWLQPAAALWRDRFPRTPLHENFHIRATNP